MSAWLMKLTDHDQRALHAIVLRRRTWLDLVMRQVTHLGDAAVTIGAAVALIAAVPAVGVRAAFALAASHVVVRLLKRSVARPRPNLPSETPFLVPLPACFSFPSGHAASALSVLLPVAGALPELLAAVVLGLALLVGVSRVYLGVHYPCDVLVGWLLAALAVALAPATFVWLRVF